MPCTSFKAPINCVACVTVGAMLLCTAWFPSLPTIQVECCTVGVQVKLKE